MGEVVAEIEGLMKTAGLGASPGSASGSLVSYPSWSPRHPDGGDSPFEYSADTLHYYRTGHQCRYISAGSI
ncbi:hypothetical protein BAE44_0007853 [Dichanthelium oligosanthes]|uniref:Uncharacterized protein n=1 Tax=Dichanthelium oligosanthes TaxID=888268 RepID=A0A1E5W1B8_9POAL|nr:hypothetical protein BAE44_0007853 [Dichanthelium oligosanthes]